MTSFAPSGALVAMLPCNDLDASEHFYNRLGFVRPDSARPPAGEADTYRMLTNGKGGYLHLTDAVEGWLVPGRNPFGLYLYHSRSRIPIRNHWQDRAGGQALGNV